MEKSGGAAGRLGTLGTMPNAPSSLVDQLKMSLRGISPMIWRCLLMLADLTLYGLRRTIQIAFGWEDYHLRAF